MNLTNLKKLLNYDDDLKVDLTQQIQQCEESLNLILSADYIKILETFGPIRIDDFLTIFSLSHQNHFIDFTYNLKTNSDLFSPSNNYSINDPFPYTVWPESDGLISWGNTDNGDMLFWIPSNENVVVVDSKVWEWKEYPYGLIEFLCKILQKSLICDIFPEDFPDEYPDDYYSFEKI